jgi:outer membrane protease
MDNLDDKLFKIKDKERLQNICDLECAFNLKYSDSINIKGEDHHIFLTNFDQYLAFENNFSTHTGAGFFTREEVVDFLT